MTARQINATDDHMRPVRIWIYAVAALVLLMVAVGGMTRLTESGLSIVSWKPLSGTIPPLSLADWQAEFDAYKQIPQYTSQHHWMSLEDFKLIFWWEWGHRFLGRVIGLAFFVPFVVFLVQKRLPRSLVPSLAILFILGGFQGFLGWWMVSSGLSVRTDVSQYRLAAHLGAACLLFVALIWVARSLVPPRAGKRVDMPMGWRWAVAGLGAVLYLQLIAGAFVAGLDAGLAHNTWPLMDGRFIPNGLGIMQPGWKNLFENGMTVQFNHRMIAYFIAAYAFALFWFGRKNPGFTGVNGWMPRIALLVGLQIALGIATLLAVVPISLAIGHQVLAFMLIGAVTAYSADMARLSR